MSHGGLRAGQTEPESAVAPPHDKANHEIPVCRCVPSCFGVLSREPYPKACVRNSDTLGRESGWNGPQCVFAEGPDNALFWVGRAVCPTWERHVMIAPVAARSTVQLCAQRRSEALLAQDFDFNIHRASSRHIRGLDRPFSGSWLCPTRIQSCPRWEGPSLRRTQEHLRFFGVEYSNLRLEHFDDPLRRIRQWLVLFPLIELAPTYINLFKDGEILILSGTLKEQCEKIFNCYNQYFDSLEVLRKDEWCLVSGIKKTKITLT